MQRFLHVIKIEWAYRLLCLFVRFAQGLQNHATSFNINMHFITAQEWQRPGRIETR